MSSGRFFVTTPIYYVNGAPHLGHAYTSIAADTLARWARQDGRDVFFLTGTDEHGQKVAQAAAQRGQTPQGYADAVAAEFRAMAVALDVSFDDFIRTTEPRHKRACTEFWQRLAEAGQIYEGSYEGWYSVRDEAFWGEDELVPDASGTLRAPTGAPVERVTEPSFFFRLSDWGDRLLALYEAEPDFLGPAARRNEIVNFVRSGLRDLSISRTSFSWGVPVPGAPGHVMYVWVDALINYLSALGWPDRTEAMRFWPADLHLVGKEIARFHAVYWPAFLMAAGLPVPRRVFSHGWWTVEGAKMSKSVGNVVDPHALRAEFGVDPVRFFLLREVPFGGDGDFSRRALVSRLNTELANGLGNLAQRTLTQLARNCAGRLPPQREATPEDAELRRTAAALPARMRASLGREEFGAALEDAWVVVRAANAYIDRAAPWTLLTTDPARMEDVLRVLHDALRALATVLAPFMPGSMARLLDQLGVPAPARDFASLSVPLPGGTVLPPPAGLFPRFRDAPA